MKHESLGLLLLLFVSLPSKTTTSYQMYMIGEPKQIPTFIVYVGLFFSRKELVEAATSQARNGGVPYSTTAQNIKGLLAPGSEGINHGIIIKVFDIHEPVL